MEKHMVVCPYCGTGCKFNLLVENDLVVGAEPLNGLTNEGFLCLKGWFGYDFINDTKILTPRVLHPMMREEKGAGLVIGIHENALRQSGMSRALSIAMTRAGMRMICRMMPGMAVVTAPARKSAGVKALCARPASR